MLTLYNVITGRQHLKDHVPVKDASLCKIFGDDYKADVTAWFKNEHASTMSANDAEDAHKALNLYLKRIEITRFTRTELTDLGFLEKGTGALAETAQTRMQELAKARLQQLIDAYGSEGGQDMFRKEVLLEGRVVNWSASQSEQFIQSVLA
jgi:hypothetical protein